MILRKGELHQHIKVSMMLKEILTPDIHYYTEVFDNPEELIKEIELMDQFQDMGSQISKWEPWNSSCKTVQYGYEKTINYKNVLNNNNRDRHNSKFASMIHYRAIQIAEEYALAHQIDLGDLPTHCKIYKYNNSTEMGPHTDWDPDYSPQHLTGTVSIVFYLNDNYQGGDLAFPNDNLSVKPKPGSAVVFKSHGILHEPLPTTEGTKYMVAIFFFRK